LSSARFLSFAAIAAGAVFILLGLLVGYAWMIGQGMPHAASAQGMKLWEGALIFGPIVAGAALAVWGWRRLRRRD
jgi:hypothetical protein